MSTAAASLGSDKDARRRRGRWAVALLVAVLGLVAALVVGGLQPWRHVPVPPASASPAEVVRAYTAASAASDRGTMRAIAVDDHGVPSWVDILMGSRTEYRDVVIHPARAWPTAHTEARGWRQATYVPVDFVVVGGASSGFSDGPTTWGYVLVRNADDEPWRIIDQGVG